jgi:hypothetical protein
MPHTHELSSAIASVRLGEAQTFRSLTLFPLTGDSDGASYVLLDEALDRHLVRVTEVSESGSVPELAFENASAESVLLVDGDELVGAKQNRVLNLSILVSGGKKLVIPVSCVEQGRWRYRSAEFGAAKRTLFAKARARKAQSVSAAMSAHGERRANQSQVWADVAGKAAALRVESQTAAMSDIYTDNATTLNEYVHAFRAVSGQKGAVVAIGSRVVGLELFDSAVAFSHYLEKLVRAYALDAIDTVTPEISSASETAVRSFLERVTAAPFERFAALGEGEDLRFTGIGIAGGALAKGGRVVHLAAFAAA